MEVEHLGFDIGRSAKAPTRGAPKQPAAQPAKPARRSTALNAAYDRGYWRAVTAWNREYWAKRATVAASPLYVGRQALAVKLCASEMSAADVIDVLTVLRRTAPTASEREADRRAAADALWDRAYARMTSKEPTATKPATKADAVWDRAYRDAPHSN